MGEAGSVTGVTWVDLPETRAAIAAGDWSRVLRICQTATGLNQQALADRTGIHQSTISRFVSGARTPRQVDTLRSLCHGLGIPVELVGLADTIDGDTDTDRRTFLATTVTASSVTLLSGLLHDDVALPDLSELARPTESYRRIEALASSRMLRTPATSHLNMLRQLASTAERHHNPSSTRRLHTLVSESAGFAAWLAADCDDRSGTRNNYLLAISAAERADHALLTCYMRASLAQYAASQGDTINALMLVERARTDLPRRPPPVAEAWLDCMEACILASTQDEKALRLLDSASKHLTSADPVWPWLLPIDAAKLATYRDLVSVRLRRNLGDITSLTHPAHTPFPKQSASALTERATALADLGDHDNACLLAMAVFDIAHKYSSEKLLRAVIDVRTRIHPHARGDRIAALDARIASIYTPE